MDVGQRKALAAEPLLSAPVTSLTILGARLDHPEFLASRPPSQTRDCFMYLVPEYALPSAGGSVKIPHQGFCFAPDLQCLIVLTGEEYAYDQGGDIPAPFETRLYHGYGDLARFLTDVHDLKKNRWPKRREHEYQHRMARPLFGIDVWVGSAQPLSSMDIEAYNLIYRVPSIHIHLKYK